MKSPRRPSANVRWRLAEDACRSFSHYKTQQNTMRFISVIRARASRPQFGLATLFGVMTVAAVPLAIWASREHAYQRRVAAGILLIDRDAPGWSDVEFISGDDGDPDGLGAYKDILERGDVVTKIRLEGDGNAALSDAQVTAILCFPEVAELDIWKFGVTDSQMAELSRLQCIEGLELTDSRIAAVGLRHLTAMRSLRELNLSATCISDATLAHIAALKKLEVLWLVDTNVTDNGLRYVGTLRSLIGLGLGETRITDAGMVHLGELTRLEYLDLQNNSIGDEALHFLARLPRLASLDLMETRVTDDGLKTLRRFRALEILSLHSCEISDAGLVYLADVPLLRQLNVFCAKCVTAEGVARLQRLRPDVTISWQEKSTSH